ncbi:MAG: carbohydrate kinase family protein [Clostridia bacterium]|nr:carbohydrate kinase family protein [Clostridia bacterium]
MPDSIIIGAAIVDIPLSPVTPDIFTAHSTPLQRIAMGLGGDAANESLVLARLGHAPALVSVVGRDAPGDFVCQTLSRSGVDVSTVTVREGLDTGINVVLVRPDGERSFITSRSGSLRQLSLSDILPALDAPSLSGTRVACLASLFVSPQLTLEDTATLFDVLKSRGLILCADTTRPKHGETLREAADILSRLDFFFPNLDEASALTGQKDPDAVADALLDCGVKHVALKLGSRGCLLKSRVEHHLDPAIPGVKCVDTTGAGDTFAGAFISAILEGRSFADCGRFANAAASLCVESIGATTGGWSRAEVEARYRSAI